MNFSDAAMEIERATSPTELFGAESLDDGPGPRQRYRLLARAVHPDFASERRQDRAHAVTAKLNVLWEQLVGGSSSTWTVTSKRHTYETETSFRRDEIANLYPCSWDDGHGLGLLRLPRSPANNDLIMVEARALKWFEQAEVQRYRPYAPTMVDVFRHRDPSTGQERTAIVTERLAGFYTLAEVRQAYPTGLDGRDIAWIWRRLLVGIGWAHQVGLIHGAILPETVLIHPTMHGVVLTDWSYSVEPGETLTARVNHTMSRNFYPVEVFNKEPVGPATDIYMATACMKFLLGDAGPSAMKAFIRGSMPERLAARPQDAWALKEEYDVLLDRLYGPRQYRPLWLPDLASL